MKKKKCSWHASCILTKLAKGSTSGSLVANIAEDPGVLGFGGCPYKRKVAGNRKGEGFWSRKKEKQRLKARKRERERGWRRKAAQNHREDI